MLCSQACSHAWRRLQVFISNSDWFIAKSTSAVIGWSGYFSLLLVLTVNWKPVYWLEEKPWVWSFSDDKPEDLNLVTLNNHYLPSVLKKADPDFPPRAPQATECCRERMYLKQKKRIWVKLQVDSELNNLNSNQRRIVIKNLNLNDDTNDDLSYLGEFSQPRNNLTKKNESQSGLSSEVRVHH